MDLRKRVDAAIEKGRKSGSDKADASQATEEGKNTIFITGWLNGVEDALTEIVGEIEKLSPKR